MKHRLTALVVIVASCLAVSACGSSAKSAEPASATGTDVNGQQGFARYWVSTVNKATTSGNTKPMRKLAAKSCSTCAQFADTLDTIYKSGGHVDTKGWQILSMIPIGNQPKSTPGLQLSLKFTPQTVYKTKGAAPKQYPGGKQAFRFFLTRQGDHWLVQRLDV